MNQSKVKNMVILKNLPSNIVEEAIVILKSNKKVKKLEKIEKNKTADNKKISIKENDYVLKEAEMLVSNYISKIEEKQNEKKLRNKKIDKKYIRIKNYALISTVIVFLETLLLIAK